MCAQYRAGLNVSPFAFINTNKPYKSLESVLYNVGSVLMNSRIVSFSRAHAYHRQ